MKCHVVICVDRQERRIIVDTYPTIARRILKCHVKRAIGAAIVHDGVVPVDMALGYHAFNTPTEVPFAVVDRSHYAHKRLFRHSCNIAWR